MQKRNGVCFAFACIVSVIAAWPANAADDEFEYVSNCKVYQVCKGKECFRNAEVYSSFWKIRSGKNFFISVPESETRHAIGMFETLDAAKLYLEKNGTLRFFGSFLVPQPGWADAQGFTMHSVSVTGDNKIFVANEYSVISCGSRGAIEFPRKMVD